MRLNAQIKAERGKEINRTANEYIKIQLTENRENIYRVEYNGETLKVLKYATGKQIIIE